MLTEVFDLNYPSRPSWRRTGEGRATIKVTINHQGGLDIRAGEWPEGLRGGKEVYVTVPPEEADKLLKAMMNRKAGEVIEQVEGQT